MKYKSDYFLKVIFSHVKDKIRNLNVMRNNDWYSTDEKVNFFDVFLKITIESSILIDSTK